eukprot:4092472-Pyramimonas_sp.AAC.1
MAHQVVLGRECDARGIAAPDVYVDRLHHAKPVSLGDVEHDLAARVQQLLECSASANDRSSESL